MKKKIIIILLIVLSLSSFSIAAENTDPLKGVERSSPLNWKSEKKIWKPGKIDSIFNNKIVINDTEYYLSDDTHYYLETGKRIKSSSFSSGDMVIFVLGSGKRDKIVSLIKMEK